jgi:hypothetical protein
MERQDARLLQQWVTQWQDLCECEFEFVPVVPSKDTVDIITPLL